MGLAVPFITFALYINQILLAFQMFRTALVKLGGTLQLLAILVYEAVKFGSEILIPGFRKIPAIIAFLARLARLFWSKCKTGLTVMLAYPDAKKKAREHGEDWSKRRYVIGGWLRRMEARRRRNEEIRSDRLSAGLRDLGPESLPGV